jgi:hypothetical protein
MPTYEKIGEKKARLQQAQDGHIKTMQNVGRTADTIKAIRLDELEKRYEATKRRIEELNDRRHDLILAAVPKSELLEMAKQALRDMKKQEFTDSVLMPLLQQCQEKGIPPFDPTWARVKFDPDQCWRLLYLCITEEEIEAAVAQLPDDVGIPKPERDRRLKEIDTEIAALVEQVEKDLAELKKETNR